MEKDKTKTSKTKRTSFSNDNNRQEKLWTEQKQNVNGTDRHYRRTALTQKALLFLEGRTTSGMLNKKQKNVCLLVACVNVNSIQAALSRYVCVAHRQKRRHSFFSTSLSRGASLALSLCVFGIPFNTGTFAVVVVGGTTRRRRDMEHRFR